MQRIRITVQGIVQGVGFRPYVWRAATQLQLSGWVCNTGAGVCIEAQGEAARLQQFIQEIRHIPAPAQIRSLDESEIPLVPASEQFIIQDNQPTGKGASIGADLAPCADCLRDIFDAKNRRYHYPFTHCTCCGPRYTVTRNLPYTRSSTSMGDFALCPQCAAEYANPADRRFHAEAIACPHCGPRLDLQLANGASIACDVQHGEILTGYAIAATLALLSHGAIVAIKGVGGFHLCCDARNEAAIQRIRENKPRARKPLALMTANLASLSNEVLVSADEARWLQSPERPIVLLQRAASSTLPESLAPGLNTLGVMLPYTPMHYLLFNAAAEHPDAANCFDQAQKLMLVMTSANPSGAPVCIDDAQAREQLAHLADAFLINNRPIVARNDDSVLRVRSDGSACFLRRARGYAPLPLSFPPQPFSTLALGAELKSTLCLSTNGLAHLSTHIGDLDDTRSCRVLAELAQSYPEKLGIAPQRITCDLHPDLFSTLLADQLDEALQAPLIQVQHHHAHIAAVLAEHGFDGEVLGLALDGYGYGNDGTSWGGELLIVNRTHCERAGHLATLLLPGGDLASREPWRMATAVLTRLGRQSEITTRFAEQPAAKLLTQLQLDSGAPYTRTSSLGRWIDAASGLLGVCLQQDYEAEAAQRLESLAVPCAAMPEGWLIDENNVLDFLPLFARLADESNAVDGASLLHATLVAGLSEWLIRTAQQRQINTVAFGGGCWANRWLDEGISQRAQAAGLTVLRPGVLPPGDGAISVGQAWVAGYTNGI
ncbi:carbamoyltransferase HypF [Chitinibacter sp. S2-10]|uniref:carbamoyltransferase HypF n=1 Tax=Chitinibacter sp. S2-10 TaxID=3373597 RepID=UPI003977425E